jgi:hypothetical protein
MLNSEQVLDVLPYAVDIFEKLDLKGYIEKNKTQVPKNASKEKVEQLQREKGLDMMTHILRNAPKAKEEIFQLVAVLQNTTPDEVRKQSFVTTLKYFKEVLTDKELMGFFKAAMQ